MSNLRLIQVFLSSKAGPSGPSIFEVSGDDSFNFVCTCPGYAVRKTCRHITFVKARLEANNGKYPLEIPPTVSQDDIKKAMSSSETFREFLLKHGKIEVY